VNVQGFSKELDAALKTLATVIRRDDIPADVKKKTEYLLEQDIPESLRYIQTSTAKMDSLLAGLLRISRLGREGTHEEQLDMNKMMSMVVQTIEFRIKQTGATVTCAGLPACRGDALQINQVFSNLLDNALKYLDPGRPGAITISGRSEKGRSIYCVEDNGIGIPPEQQQKIFMLFYKLDPATPGEGLGMSIITRVLEKNHGKVWVESEVGKGSKFYVELPG
jgi:signal transduction histidine kinase